MAEDTPEVFAAEKTLAIPQEWTDMGGGRLQLVHSLDTDDGVTRQGLLFRAKARLDLPDMAVLLQLEYPQDGRGDHAIERIEWRPINSPHRNTPRGPCGHLHESFVHGSHRHLFECNWLEHEGRLLSNNLPIAEPLNPEPSDFHALLELAADCFRIRDLAEHVRPPWRPPEGLFAWRT